MSGPPAAASASVAEEAGPSHQNVGRWSKSISEKDTVLAIQVAAWLRKRGKALRPKLNDEQKQQLEECFELMDADGSGAIDADELGAAFKLLGLHVKRTEIGELLAEVDSDGNGEVEYPEFIEIMTSTLAKLAEKKEQEGSAGNQVPFALLATAYRRKRIMEGLISGDKEMTAQVVAIAEEAARRAAEEAAAHQTQHGHRHASHGSSAASSHSSSRHSSANGSVQHGSAHGSSAENMSSSGGSSSGSSSSSSLRAVQAAAPQGLLRSLQKIKSMKNSGALLEALTAVDSSSRSVGASSAGEAGASCVPGLLATFGGDLAALLGEQAHAQLVEMLRQGARQRLNNAQQASTRAVAPVASKVTAPSFEAGGGRSSFSGGQVNGSIAAVAAAAGKAATTSCKAVSGRSSPSGGRGAAGAARAGGLPGALGAPAAALLGANQHMTSKLQQKVLTQEVQLPQFALSMPRSGASSPAAAEARSSSSSRAPSTSSSPVPLNPTSPSRYRGPSPSNTLQAALIGTQTARLGVSGLDQPAAAVAAGSAAPFGDCTIHEFMAGQDN